MTLKEFGNVGGGCPRSQSSAQGGLFAKHEIFTPIKAYPPMTVRDLAAERTNNGAKTE